MTTPWRRCLPLPLRRRTFPLAPHNRWPAGGGYPIPDTQASPSSELLPRRCPSRYSPAWFTPQKGRERPGAVSRIRDGLIWRRTPGGGIRVDGGLGRCKSMLSRQADGAEGPNRPADAPGLASEGLGSIQVYPACRIAVEETATAADRVRYHPPTAEMIVATRGQ